MPTIVDEFYDSKEKDSLYIENGILNIGRTSIPLKKINSVSVQLHKKGSSTFFDYNNYKKYLVVRIISLVLLGPWFLFANVILSAEFKEKELSLFEILGLIKELFISGLEAQGVERLLSVIFVPLPIWCFIVFFSSLGLMYHNKKKRREKGIREEPEREEKNRLSTEFNLEIVTSSGKQQLLSFYDYKFLDKVKSYIMEAVVHEGQNEGNINIVYDKSSNNYFVEEKNFYGDITIRNDYQGLDESQIEKMFSVLKPSLEEAMKKAYNESNDELKETLNKLVGELKNKKQNPPVLKDIVKSLGNIGDFNDIVEVLSQTFSL